MGLGLTVVAAAVLIAVLVYLRYMARRHVAALFRSTARKLLAQGASVEAALREAAGRFVRRAPFNLIREDELAFFFGVLQDVGSPVEVGARILQQCEIKSDVSGLRNKEKTTRLIYETDLRFNLHQLIRNARILHKKARHLYPNITIALLASLSAREGWLFSQDQDDALLFNYGQKTVRVPKHGSGKDAAKLILFEETVQRPMLDRPGLDIEVRKSARQKYLDSFDSLFDKVFQSMGSM